MECLRILLLIFNIIFVLIGIAVVSIGIWTAVSKVYISFVLGNTLFSAASYLVIAVGVAIILVCVIGIVALRKQRRKWYIAYLILLIFCFIILITAAVLAVVFKGEMESVMVENMRKSLINGYEKDSDITSAWDQLQSELQCCAVSERDDLPPSILFQFPYVDNTNPQSDEERAKQDSWAIFKRTEFYKRQLNIGVNDRKYVPPSCCVYDQKVGNYKNLRNCQYFSSGPPFNYALQLQNDYLFYTGCYEKGKQFVLDQSDILLAVGFTFAFLMIAGMVLTFFVLRSVVEDQDTSHRRQPRNQDL